MTNFVRYAVIGAIVAGASVYGLAQDAELDALLKGLIDQDQEELIIDEPALDEGLVDDIATDITEEADDAIADVEAEMDVAEDVADEAIAEAETDVEDATEDVAEDIVEDVAEDIADVEEDVVDEVTEDIADPEEALDDLIADVEEDVEEDVVSEELVDEVADEIAEITDEVADEVAEDVADEIVDEVAEDVADEIVDEVAEDVADEIVDEVAEDVADEIVDDVAEATEDEIVEDIIADDGADDVAEEGLIAGLDLNTEIIDGDTKFNRQVNEIDELHRLKNEGFHNYANSCYQIAKEKMAIVPASPAEDIANCEEATKMFKEAIKYARSVKNAKTDNFKEKCEKEILNAVYRKAQAHLRNKDFAEAIECATWAEKRGHANAHALLLHIQEEKNKPVDIKPTVILPEYAKEDYQVSRTAIAERMKRATIYYQLAKYTDANEQVELVLRDDPTNEEAIHLRNRLNRRHADYSRNLKMSTHAKMINDVEANWTPTGALGVESEEFFAPQATASAKTPVNDQGKKDAEMIRAKLEYIRLPEFTVTSNQTIADAAQIFYDMAKLYDKPELPPEERGIAFILNSNATKKAPEPSSDEEEDPFADDSSDDSGLKPLPPINMTFVTLKEALDMVCEVSNYKYIIRGRSIMLVPAGTFTEGELVLRKYNVMQDAVQKLVQASNEMSEGSEDSSSDDGGWGSDSGGLDSGYSAVTPAVLKETFINLGVPFSQDAKIFYLSSLGKLYVTNTPENLALVENILEEFNVTPFQIEVEARFVEVSQTDLNSLGFEWRLNGDLLGTIGDGIDWTSSALGGAEVAGGTNGEGLRVFRGYGSGNTGNSNIAVHGGANAINQGTRFLGDSSLYANRVNISNSALPIDDTFASFSAVFGELDMTMVLHMLAQRSDTDMLSSPKVLATPDQEALIRVVTEWIYPTEFEIQELDNDDNNYNNNDDDDSSRAASMAPPVKFAVEPSSFEKQEVGVKLNVIPRVSPEGQMIQLTVIPQVVEYLGDFEYGMQIPYVRGVSESVLSGTTEYEIAYYTVSMPQPKFHFREINTQLSVYNGATVVMGGLITEVRRSFEDKVPLLGDLPFIGFLFRSEGDFSEKRNLLIFLTARLVDPAGRPLKTATDGRLGEQAATATTATTMGDAE